MFIRAIRKAEADDAPDLPVKIPAYPKASSPFSRDRTPYLYRPDGLEKIREISAVRTAWFLKRLCAIQRIISDDVPYYFRESNGQLRSLDAGCLGYLWWAPKKIVQFSVGAEGEIVTVRVEKSVLDRQENVDEIIGKMDTRG